MNARQVEVSLLVLILRIGIEYLQRHLVPQTTKYSCKTLEENRKAAIAFESVKELNGSERQGKDAQDDETEGVGFSFT